MVVVDAGHINDAHTAPANVAHDLVLLVEAVLAGRGGQLVSEHVPGALTPPQADHGLAPLPPRPGQAGDGDGQGQRPTATQKFLPRSFLPSLHAYLISVGRKRHNSCQLKNGQGAHSLEQHVACRIVSLTSHVLRLLQVFVDQKITRNN